MGYIRKSIHTVEEVLSLLDKGVIEYASVLVNTNSKRYKVFRERLDCVTCGMKGLFFALEKTASQSHNKYHFNLYGYDVEGNEILFTKDHIKPRSKGGSNQLSNLVTMCSICNNAKADFWEEE